MFAISTDGCRSIHSYAEAKRHYESITPIRGKPNIRPIGQRSKQHMRIDENKNEHGHYYSAILYDTECVRWFEDGRIQVRTDIYNTQSTSKFIAAVTPFNTALFDNYLWIGGFGLGFSMPIADGREGLTFKYNETMNHWECLNPPNLYARSYNKQETARLRKLPVIQEIQTYLKSMKALGAWETRFLWRTRHKVHNELHKMLQASIGVPDYVPSLEDMAKLGEYSLGPVKPDEVYKICLSLELTSPEALYVETPVPIGTMKKGIICR